MDTRRVIDLAMGVLMERTQCNADQAFALLRKHSQHNNVKTQRRRAAGSGDGRGAQVAADTKSPFKQPGARLS